MCLDPCVAVIALDDIERNKALVLLDRRVFEAAADQALDCKQGVGRVSHRLALGRLADETFAVFGECDHGGRGARAFGVLDDLRILAIHDGNAGVGGTEVDANYFSHIFSLL
ncbi:NAD-specific glutamate dehydrogenase [compost metagenome]